MAVLYRGFSSRLERRSRCPIARPPPAVAGSVGFQPRGCCLAGTNRHCVIVNTFGRVCLHVSRGLLRGPFSFNTAGPTAREVTRSHDRLLLFFKGTETMMCDSYAQFDDGAGRSGEARAVSNEDLGVIQGMLRSTGSPTLRPCLPGSRGSSTGPWRGGGSCPRSTLSRSRHSCANKVPSSEGARSEGCKQNPTNSVAALEWLNP